MKRLDVKRLVFVVTRTGKDWFCGSHINRCISMTGPDDNDQTNRGLIEPYRTCSLVGPFAL